MSYRQDKLDNGPRRSLPLQAIVTLALGHPAHLIGWGVFCFSMIFWWNFGAESDWITVFRFAAATESTQGRVTELEETNMSEGGSDDSPGTPIYRVTFQYREPGGEWLQTHGHTLGRQHTTGEEVEVEYLAKNPRIARIKGARVKPFGPWAALIGLLPIGALFTVLIGLGLGLRNLRVVRRGELVRGRLVDKSPTNTTINNRRVFKLTFEFLDRGGNAHRTSIKTHHPEKLEDDAEELLFYDPAHPEHACARDAMPGGVSVNADGSFRAVGPGRATMALLIPPLCLLPHVLVLMARTG